MPRVPVALPAGRPVAVAPKPLGAPAAAATHRVGPGETVYSIGRLYEISPATIMALNQLTPPAALAVGQVLVLKSSEPLPAAIPVTAAKLAAKPASYSATGTNPALYVPKPVTPAPAATPATQHTVAVGETLYSIARRYQVTVADLQAWNGKAGADTSAKIGEMLRVSAGGK